MFITYKCKKCKKRFSFTPDMSNLNESLRMIIVKTLMDMTENDFCYNCCEKENKENE